MVGEKKRWAQHVTYDCVLSYRIFCAPQQTCHSGIARNNMMHSHIILIDSSLFVHPVSFEKGCEKLPKDSIAPRILRHPPRARYLY